MHRIAAFVAACSLVIALFPAIAQPALAAQDPSRFTATPLTPDSTFSVVKSVTGRLAQTDPSLLSRTDSTAINVLIKYDYDATASYAGGVSGLTATSPAVTGKKLKDNKSAVAAYENNAKQRSKDISRAVSAAVPAAAIGTEFVTAYGGVAARIPANSVATLLKVPGVAAVQLDNLAQPLSDATEFIGATDVWPSLGGATTAASNVVVGILDTGIWPEHPMFADNGLPPVPGGPYGCQFGNGSDSAHLGDPFACNRKLVGAYAFTSTYLSVFPAKPGEFCNNATHICSPRDPEGHGTHTSSTAAGSQVSSALLYGVDRGPVSGVAPGARVIMYRVCLEQGCFNSDSVAAVQQAITDGIDVINFSIGGGANPYTDAVEIAFLNAFDAGISVNASAGNSGPGVGTAEHGGPWVTTVGAATSDRFFTSTLHLTADGGATFNKAGVTITNGIPTATPVVLAETLAGEDALCHTPLAAGQAAGKIVACQRGDNARVDKGYNVSQGGAAGMILYNPVKQDVETDNHWLPAIHVDGPNADLLSFITTHTNVKATWSQGTATPTQGDVMAAFSSRGGPANDFIKPDVTAPGIQVLAGMTPEPVGTVNGPTGNFYQAIAGTSMSSPHAAGASALVKAAHPDWTPAMIKSALMTSAAQGVVKEDGTSAATPFDDGSGSVRVNRAVNPTVVFNETTARFVASASDPLHRIDLNLASVNAPTMTGSITTKRTLTNVSGDNLNLGVSVQEPSGAKIFVSESATGGATKKVDIKKGKSKDIWITISGATLANGQYFGRITLDAGRGNNDVTIPVAFNKKQGIVSLTHSCTPTTFAPPGAAHCLASVSNFAATSANVNLTITNPDGGLTFSNASAPATLDHNTVRWSGTLSPAIAPKVTSITLDEGPAGGYLPLSIFGIAPVSGVGDDTISNFNVPAFFFGAEPYTRVGVVSNGYLVIGGGAAADLVFTPQHFPNPARPNNVVAPLWSDLNPSSGGAGAIRVGVLTDGDNSWLVVDWAGVKNFGNATTHTFEIWIQLAGGSAGTGPESEWTTMTYGIANAGTGDPDSGVNWGAENRDGTSGANLAAAPGDNTEYRVNTTPPTAGGTQTIQYQASGKKAGTYSSVASMTSNVTPGTTQVVVNLTLTKK
ncbi:MAG TPA: S8 family serine peptidase [Candidatus Limnocylindria bacterium]